MSPMWGYGAPIRKRRLWIGWQSAGVVEKSSMVGRSDDVQGYTLSVCVVFLFPVSQPKALMPREDCHYQRSCSQNCYSVEEHKGSTLKGNVSSWPQYMRSDTMENIRLWCAKMPWCLAVLIALCSAFHKVSYNKWHIADNCEGNSKI